MRPSASLLICEHIYGGDCDVYYAACELRVVGFGAKAGVYDTPISTDAKKYTTYLNNVVTTMITLHDVQGVPYPGNHRLFRFCVSHLYVQ
jgi:hypothetical protein